MLHLGNLRQPTLSAPAHLFINALHSHCTRTALPLSNREPCITHFCCFIRKNIFPSSKTPSYFTRQHTCYHQQNIRYHQAHTCYYRYDHLLTTLYNHHDAFRSSA
ncbi:hypothetical protein CEP53_012369 [Fusarium sp. AF-6]|nr:hypothetical protein CEP53_012369 [Fusarium sp. AF-6]